MKRNPNKAVFDVVVFGMGTDSRAQYLAAKAELGRVPHVMIFEQNIERTINGEGGYRDARFFGWDLGNSTAPLYWGALLVGNRKVVSIEKAKGNDPAKYRLATDHGDVFWTNKIAMERDMNRYTSHWTHDLPVTQLVRDFLETNAQQPLARSTFELPGRPLLLAEKAVNTRYSYFNFDYGFETSVGTVAGYLRRMRYKGKVYEIAVPQSHGSAGFLQKVDLQTATPYRNKTTARAGEVSAEISLGASDFIAVDLSVAEKEDRPSLSVSYYDYYKNVIRTPLGIRPRSKRAGDSFDLIMHSQDKRAYYKLRVRITEDLPFPWQKKSKSAEDA